MVPSLPLPDPPLADGVIRLRRWGEAGRAGVATDAEALAAAWADPDVQRWSAVPPPAQRSVSHAARWIGDEAARRRDGLALDLVISPATEAQVLGEVGLAPIDWDAVTADIGWWVAPTARGGGIATRAVGLLAGWARTTLRLAIVAAVDPANRASRRVAERAGVDLAPWPRPADPAGSVHP
jgi:RimJ/RimL family protein N-acetyltransferase